MSKSSRYNFDYVPREGKLYVDTSATELHEELRGENDNMGSTLRQERQYMGKLERMFKKRKGEVATTPLISVEIERQLDYYSQGINKYKNHQKFRKSTGHWRNEKSLNSEFGKLLKEKLKIGRRMANLLKRGYEESHEEPYNSEIKGINETMDDYLLWRKKEDGLSAPDRELIIEALLQRGNAGIISNDRLLISTYIHSAMEFDFPNCFTCFPITRRTIMIG